MFGFIKNLAKKNDNNFFLELKEDVEDKISDVKEEIKDTKEKVTAKVKEVKEETKQEAKKAAKPAPAPKQAPAPAAASSNGKVTIKEAADARPKDPSEIAAAAVAAKKVELPKETNFATKYLMTPSSNGRRRPGPNMNSFLEMASKVKTPTEKK